MKLRRNFTSFGRIAHTGARNFFRNAWLSTAATAVMLVTLTILLSSIALNLALGDTIKGITREITVSVYLKEGVTREDAAKLENALAQSYNVLDINFKDETEALSDFQEQYQDDPEILAGIGLTDNIFPASYEVNIDDLSQIDAVVSVAKSEQFSEVVDDTSDDAERRKSIDRIASAQDFITLASLVMGGVFGGIAVLIIFNTIRMAIFTRQEEIGIMKLIGATPGYIRGPFLFEASLYGIIAALLSIVVVYSGLLALGPKVVSHIEIDPTIDFFVDQWFVVFAVTIGAGLLLGFISSSLALSKYLRLKRW